MRIGHPCGLQYRSRWRGRDRGAVGPSPRVLLRRLARIAVSHWAVDSDAAVKLITRTLRTMAEDKSVGRSEALRRSILALIEGGDAHEAHPAIWAPFVLPVKAAARRPDDGPPPGRGPVQKRRRASSDTSTGRCSSCTSEGARSDQPWRASNRPFVMLITPLRHTR